jgi:hypothetical protein
MSLALKLALFLIALTAPLAGYVYYNSALSPDDWVYQGGGNNWKDAGIHAAPGPLVGAGLPALFVIGGGYWVARRLRRKAGK